MSVLFASFHCIDRAGKQRQAIHTGDDKGKGAVQVHLHNRKLLRHRRRCIRYDGGKRRGLAALLVKLHTRGMLHLRDGHRLIKIGKR